MIISPNPLHKHSSTLSKWISPMVALSTVGIGMMMPAAIEAEPPLLRGIFDLLTIPERPLTRHIDPPQLESMKRVLQRLSQKNLLRQEDLRALGSLSMDRATERGTLRHEGLTPEEQIARFQRQMSARHSTTLLKQRVEEQFERSRNQLKARVTRLGRLPPPTDPLVNQLKDLGRFHSLVSTFEKGLEHRMTQPDAMFSSMNRAFFTKLLRDFEQLDATIVPEEQQALQGSLSQHLTESVHTSGSRLYNRFFSLMSRLPVDPQQNQRIFIESIQESESVENEALRQSAREFQEFLYRSYNLSRQRYFAV